MSSIHRLWACLAVVAVTACGPTARPLESTDVLIETGAGTIKARIALAAAPISSCNFLRYTLVGDYDGGRFFRTVRGVDDVPIDVIQLEARQGEEFSRFAPIPLERTSQTGLRHSAGALSMARWGPDTATSSFSIVARPSPTMDFGGARNPDRQGFAVFGKVVSGMEVVHAIHEAPARKEQLVEPVAITRIALADKRARTAQAVVHACSRYWDE